MEKIEGFLSKVYFVLTTIGGLAIALMMLHITADVAMRYIFNMPLPGTITVVSQYYMLIAIFIPLAYAEHINAHISVELFTERMPDWLRVNLEGWVFMASSLVCFILALRTWEEALKRFSSSTSVMQGDYSIIVWPSYFILPVGFFLLSLVLAVKFASYISGLFLRIKNR